MNDVAAQHPPAPPGQQPATATTSGVMQPASPAAPDFESEMHRLLEVAVTGTLYQLLKIAPDSSEDEIRRSYYQLAREFHPDQHLERPDCIAALQCLLDAFACAHKVLSDPQSRKKYDRQLAARAVNALPRQETAEEYLNRANHCLRAEDSEGAIAWLRKCVEIAPRESRYRVLLARTLAAAPAHRPEAIEQYVQALQLDSWNAAACFQLAELFEEMKLPWRALPLYRRIIEMDPDHGRARKRLAKLAPPLSQDGRRNPLARLFSKK